MEHAYSSWLPRPLAALGLLLATIGTPPLAAFARAATCGTGGTPQGMARAGGHGNGRGGLAFATPATYGGSMVGVLPNLAAEQGTSVDATAPTVTLASTAGPSGSSTSNGGPFAFTATFSEPITGFAASSISVTNGSVAGGPSGSGTTYDFIVTPLLSGTPTTVTVLANAARDAVGNPSEASAPYSLTYNRPLSVAPTLLSPTNGSLTPGVLIIGGSAPSSSFVVITATNTSTGFSASRSTSASGNNSFSSQFTLSSGTYQAVAMAQQSSNQPASSAPITFTVDATAPTATISTTATSPTSTSPIPFTVTFSEPVRGFTASSVLVSNGTITTAITTVGNDYSFGVTPTVNGVVTVRVPDNAVRDAVSNQNTGSSPLSVTYAAPVTLTTWTGVVSPDWYTAGNWTMGMPTATVDALIPAGTIFSPAIAAGTAAAQRLTLNPGATLIQSGGTLGLAGNLTNNGTFAATGGTVATVGSAAQVLGGSSPLAFQSLSIGAAGATLGTRASFRRVLVLVGDLTTNGQPLTLLSSVSGGVATDGLVVNDGGVVVGTATVQRASDPSVNPGLGYRHYSAPVSNSTVGDLATSGFQPVVNPAYNTAPVPGSVQPFPTVFGYDENRLATTAASNNLSPFDKGYFSPAALSDPLAVGRGYTVHIGASEVVDFQGSLNSGNLTLPLTSTRATNADGGWHLVGNPYPAPLDYSRVAAFDRESLESAIYIYSSTGQYTGQYRSYINGIGNPVLPLGQGFFVRVAAGQSAGAITFRNSQRLSGPSGTAFQRAAASPRPLVQLELRAGTGTGPAAADAFYAYAEAGATAPFDRQYDALKVPNTTGLNLASVAASGESLSIDGRAAFTATTALPLTLGVPAAGTYALAAAALANLPLGLDAYLADAQTGQLVKLAAGSSYGFSVSAAQATAPLSARFSLVFRPATALATTASLSATDVAVYPNPAHEHFTVVLPGLAQATTVQAELLNALGQVVRRQSAALPITGTQLPLETAGLATGVYTLRLQAGGTTLAKRVVIK